MALLCAGFLAVLRPNEGGELPPLLVDHLERCVAVGSHERRAGSFFPNGPAAFHFPVARIIDFQRHSSLRSSPQGMKLCQLGFPLLDVPLPRIQYYVLEQSLSFTVFLLQMLTPWVWTRGDKAGSTG